MIAQLPATLQPREKLLRWGASSLSDAELLAILLGTGVPGRNVLHLAQDLIDAHGSLGQLLRAPPDRLRNAQGLGGMAKRCQIASVLELARRASTDVLRQRCVMDAPEMVQQHLQLHLSHLPHEVFAIMYLDVKHHLIELNPMFRGTLSQTSVYPREVVKRALDLAASAVILAHNHPSGQVHPSRADIQLTQTLKAALKLIDVTVLDHCIVSPGRALSMAKEGLM
jgi:DNA repair protein RadC